LIGLSAYVKASVNEKLRKYVGGEQALPPNAIKLNQNENEYPTSPRAIEALINYLKNNDLRRYPQQDSDELKGKLAKAYNVSEEQLIVGNGSDDVIGTVFKTVVDKGALVVSTNLTYSMYKIYAAQTTASYEEVDLQEDFTLPIDDLIRKGGKLTAVTNPNSPTGVFTEISELNRLAEGLEGKGVLLIDEAYVAFSRDNALRLVDKHSNVVIVRTLSKSHSAAGIRVGFGVAQRELVKWMDAVRDPFNIGTLNQIAASTILDDAEYVEKNIKRIIEGRKFLTAKLSELGFKVYPSEANYILLKCGGAEDAKRLEESLREQSIYVRSFPDERLRSFIRITVGTGEINTKVVEAVGRAAGLR
jgi:histidinol-phosphate aminotransferase